MKTTWYESTKDPISDIAAYWPFYQIKDVILVLGIIRWKAAYILCHCSLRS